MKKSIALVAFLGSALFSGVAFGQTTTKSQMSVDLTVNLYPMISIEIDGSGVIDNTGEHTTTDVNGKTTTENVTGPVKSGSKVVIDYKTANDYLNGKGTMKTEHLKLFSTGTYVVAVRADNLTTEGGKTIEANNFEIEAFNAKSGETVRTVTLANTDQTLIQGQAGKEQLYNINYQGVGGNVFLDKIIDSKLTTYTTNVIYSISVQ